MNKLIKIIIDFNTSLEKLDKKKLVHNHSNILNNLTYLVFIYLFLILFYF